MRVPTSTLSNTQSPDSKPISEINTNHNNNSNTNSLTNLVRATIGFHEPTSVLDLRASPGQASAAEKPTAAPEADGSSNLDQFQLDDHVLRAMDWDSIMRDLGLDEDSSPAIPPPEPSLHLAEHLHYGELGQAEFYLAQNHNQNIGYGNSSGFVDDFLGGDHVNFVDSGFDFLEDLVRVADCVDSNELELAQAVLARLNQRLRSPGGKPLHRAAFYFKEALNSVLSGSALSPARLSSWSEIVQTIRAYRAFSGISPINMFAHFTVNQAILDSLGFQISSSTIVHVVDFDIGFGGQYASLMRELVEKSTVGAPILRITAIVPENYAVETRLVKENLTQFAQELKIRFQIDFVLYRTFETLSFKSIKFVEGEKSAVLLSPTILRRLSATSGFAADLRRASPDVVVFVDGDGFTPETSGPPSFRRDIVSGLEFYATVLESIDAARVPGGDWGRRIEALLVKPRVLAAVEAAAEGRREGYTWREAFAMAGMRPQPLSQFADFQAECLLGKMNVRGFHVAKRQAELVLCWHARPLVATSAWRR